MQNWEYKKLEETCEFLDSKRKPITANKRVLGPYPYYGATGILDYVEDYLFDEELILLGEDGAKWDAGDNSAFLISGKTWVNNHAHVLRPNNNVFNNWIIYFLNYSNLMKYVKGATVPKLNQENARSIEIPLPPLEEQKRIVKILDEKFAQLETVKANAKANLQKAKDLFQSQLTKAFSNTTWENKRLGDICTITSSKRIFKDEYVPEGIPFYRTKEIKELSHGEPISLELFISKEKYENIKTQFGVPQIGDVLISAVGTIGEILVINNEDPFYFKDGNIIWMKDVKDVDSDFLKYQLTSFVEQLKEMTRGAAYNALTIEKLKECTIPLPPLPEQKHIVEQLDSLSEKVRSLEEIYTKQLANCDELKQAFLAKAFNGKL